MTDEEIEKKAEEYELKVCGINANAKLRQAYTDGFNDAPKSFSLNDIAKISYENAKKRQENGGHISVDTRSMLKHCATEVVEAAEAYQECRYFVEENSELNKRHFVSELADIICCCTIIAGKEGIDLDKAVADCLEKNRKRAEGIGDKL